MLWRNDFKRDLNIVMISSIFLFEVSNVFVLDSKSLFLIPVSATDDATVNPNGINILLAVDVTTLLLCS